MEKSVTIVITPRDRYSQLAHCLEALYQCTDPAGFDLIVLNLGYPARDWRAALGVLAGRDNYRLLEWGQVIPMEAMDRVRGHITTPYTVFMDNDTRVLPDWLPPLLETAGSRRAAVVYPVTLERAGVDQGADIRCHLFTTELRVLDVKGKPYLIEYKSHRRALPEELPESVTESQAFELHCVMFDTLVLQSLELPRMTIREHLDISLQLKVKGHRLFVDPRSRVIFDNLGTRANLADLRYFNLRWNPHITMQSSRLFERRWGYCFYSESAIYHWSSRRRLFLLMRWLFLPVSAANAIDRLLSAVRRRIRPVWDPVKDPEQQARGFYESLGGAAPLQLDHSVR